MADRVWVSSAMMDAALIMPVRNDIADNPENRPIDDGSRNRSGEALSADNFPKRIWATEDFDESMILPPLFFAYTSWVVSAAAADVLRRFDLGGGGLYPVEMLRKDRTTPIGGEWFCLNFGNVKQAFRGGRDSPKARQSGPSGTRWRLPFVLRDGDLAVTRAALEGPDIWVDPAISPAFFVSDRLAQALKVAEVDQPFGLKKCRIV
jgi:hypothetical protein